MTSKLITVALETYSKTYARQTADDFFSRQDTVTGNQILTYSNVGQVNLFILHHLFAAWQEEIQRLQSPYFDYETIEVKEALKQFMNTVSRHIAVRRKDFELLSNRAVTSTLKLMLDPYSFFEDLLKNTDTGKVSVRQIKETGRYIQIHKPFYQILVDKIENQHPIEVSVNEALAQLDEVFRTHRERLENPDRYIELFAQIVPLDKNSLFTSTPIPPVVVPEKPIVIQQQPVVVKEQPVSPLLNLQVDIEQFVKAAHTPAAPIISSPPPVVATPIKSSSISRLNEKFIKEEGTLNDKLKQASGSNLLTKKSRVTDLKTAISLNQKFLFINELFKGDNVAFNQALTQLEAATDLQVANSLLEKYAAQYKWDSDSQEVKGFVEIVERKF